MSKRTNKSDKLSVPPLVVTEAIEQQSVGEFVERAYLDYSMYVILDRALPHIVDGLKPVQRRIIYAMSQLGLRSLAKFKKSARTVGDVLGKFHPHGDTACYEAMVLMAQPFSYRYPLIDGQGNWGSADDPKSFAAMRYTEARLSHYAQLLLSELEEGTVAWKANFDGTLQEPALLPARLPNMLLNGTTGIAVGMSTDIPPHNLREVAHACVALLDDPNKDLDSLLANTIQGPDYPTEAEIISRPEELLELYRTGRGSVRMRACYEREGADIVVFALPYQVSGEKVLTQIAQQMQAKKLPLVADLKDESDHENPTRLVIVPRSQRVDVEALMSHLFATTDLERQYRVHLNCIGMDRRPRVRGLIPILKEWLAARTEIVRRRLSYRLEKVLARLHVLDALLIAYLNIDAVIAIIREEEKPKPVLIERFLLTEVQAEAILELKLRYLARLEEMKIRAEQEKLAKERDQLQKLLGSEQALQKHIRKELLADAETYGDDRRSPIVDRAQSQVMPVQDRVPATLVTVVLSQKGWVRAAKGHEVQAADLSYKAGDGFRSALPMSSQQKVLFLDTIGRIYTLAVHSLPSVRGQGEPLAKYLTPPMGAVFFDMLLLEEGYAWMGSDGGYGFVVRIPELESNNRAGKAVMNLPQGTCALPMKKITALEDQHIVVVTSEGRMLLFPVASLPLLARGKGNKMIHIPPEDLESGQCRVVAVEILYEQSALVLYSGKRKMTLYPKDLLHYQGTRGRRGYLLPRGFRRIHTIEGVHTI